MKLHPHAFVIVGDDGRGSWCIWGSTRSSSRAKGFELLAAEGDRVGAGQPVVAWDPAAIETGGRSPVCPVVALDAVAGAVIGVAPGAVQAGDELFHWA